MLSLWRSQETIQRKWKEWCFWKQNRARGICGKRKFPSVKRWHGAFAGSFSEQRRCTDLSWHQRLWSLVFDVGHLLSCPAMDGDVVLTGQTYVLLLFCWKLTISYIFNVFHPFSLFFYALHTVKDFDLNTYQKTDGKERDDEHQALLYKLSNTFQLGTSTGFESWYNTASSCCP